MGAAGISTLGITFGYGVESTAGTKPSTFTKLNRINAIGGIAISNEQIDANRNVDTKHPNLTTIHAAISNAHT